MNKISIESCRVIGLELFKGAIVALQGLHLIEGASVYFRQEVEHVFHLVDLGEFGV